MDRGADGDKEGKDGEQLHPLATEFLCSFVVLDDGQTAKRKQQNGQSKEKRKTTKTMEFGQANQKKKSKKTLGGLIPKGSLAES